MNHVRFRVKTLLIATTVVAVVLVYVLSWMRLVRSALPDAPSQRSHGCYALVGILLVAVLFAMLAAARQNMLADILAEKVLPLRMQLVDPRWSVWRVLVVIALLYGTAAVLVLPPEEPDINTLMIGYYLAYLPDAAAVFCLGILWSYLFLIPRVQQSFPVLCTETGMYVPGHKFIAWKWLQKYEWVDRADGRLKLIAPAARAWLPIKVTIHPDDIDAVDEFLSNKLSENAGTR